MRIKMINTYRGFIGDEQVRYPAGEIVEGEHAEAIKNHQPTWCEVLESGTEEQPEQKPETPKGQAAGETQGEAPEETPQEVGEKPTGDEGVGSVKWLDGPPADKMMTPGRGKTVTKSLDALSIAELRELAKKKGVTGASRMKKAEIIERIREAV